MRHASTPNVLVPLATNDMQRRRLWKVSPPGVKHRARTLVFQGNYGQALRAIAARAVLMPSKTDLYFPPEDNALDVAQMQNAKLDPIPSVWGHFAGGLGLNRDDVHFIDSRLQELLAS